MQPVVAEKHNIQGAFPIGLIQQRFSHDIPRQLEGPACTFAQTQRLLGPGDAGSPHLRQLEGPARCHGLRPNAETEPRPRSPDVSPKWASRVPWHPRPPSHPRFADRCRPRHAPLWRKSTHRSMPSHRRSPGKKPGATFAQTPGCATSAQEADVSPMENGHPKSASTTNAPPQRALAAFNGRWRRNGRWKPERPAVGQEPAPSRGRRCRSRPESPRPPAPGSRFPAGTPCRPLGRKASPRGPGLVIGVDLILKVVPFGQEARFRSAKSLTKSARPAQNAPVSTPVPGMSSFSTNSAKAASIFKPDSVTVGIVSSLS